ncbi:hypothetical protein E2320_013215 [Naja naja]|nr:hypothetical protein E2320_013215 [Naja naja]
MLQNVRNFQRQRLVVWLDGHQPRGRPRADFGAGLPSVLGPRCRSAP